MVFPLSPASAVDSETVVRFVSLIREEIGNVVPHARLSFLGEILSRRSRSHGFETPEEYLDALMVDRIEGEWENLIPLITVKESYFFRAPQHFEVIRRHFLPRLLKTRLAKGERRLRFWSVACARGEEPGTLALLLADEPALSDWNWEILATDIDEEALAAARRGLYGERAVAQVPERLKERWLTRRGQLYELHPGLRQRIDYRLLNLARPPYRELGEEPFDLILLRNVLIYFRRPLQRRVAAEVSRRLDPEGLFFLGASETLWQVFNGMTPVDYGGCFAYRHRQPGDDRPVIPPPPNRLVGSPAAQQLRPIETVPVDPNADSVSSRDWQESSSPRSETTGAPEAERSESTSLAPLTSLTSLTSPALPGKVDESGTSVEFSEALVTGEGLDGLEPLSDSPEISASGRIKELVFAASRALAENDVEACQKHLAEAREADGMEPAVPALSGFVADLLGNTDEALVAYRGALFLDPTLYQVRALLADCFVRLGNPRRAGQEFRRLLADLGAGDSRDLIASEDLPLPDRKRAEKRARQFLRSL